ncbi:U11/U12 small nuclear ribonucleoprotein 48 kDa protein isoform X1 [Tripterygium wilfordii]|uniref:U11/U12 small nuclear ribonucleoprotein 48 kDa protein isoform X1 n=1 Tax=Tripterygium wilfordii TaxID=458696 RepID=A0A7J7DS17_TRIWF|nr:U11/U12 small nuclear ribonucleoprotein 48 kDa protein [Tripterygium wilfordii]XP_038699279.1 U11/U12 small nuclear ribonucleoprotein 48 kDa protein [Tripterygium wilfordii]XP_038699281.1 U11/U12 small nuclear ribonucleoprotein 48 kDa protein [Tripterygium wilfordii]XP_038699282.1 U11/U12 small nuclear ribonucleoprotein 48 kDa protein [Tripterygium wilfordii]XP_038699283.1 U11/U12 small nuclear ribonucleoprotein 48 kDa protein [Tripterygium wilfordii]KAF5749202.1 U11/U12 small nuclear ribon
MHPFSHYQSFTLPHQAPVPSPNPNFSSSQNPTSPNFNVSFNSQKPPILDLSATLSSLTSLISQSRQTLDSLSTLLPLPPKPDHVPCPFNPHHLMPPESLFLHSLRCPFSPIPPITDDVLDSLHYPKTLNSHDRVPFTQELPDPCAELCFSLDDYYGNFGSNFFYKDCPAVVNSLDLDDSKRMLTLPGVLLKECANFVVRDGRGEVEVQFSERLEFKVLPSEFWTIRVEVEGWGGNYPIEYSYSVACAILGSKIVKNSNLTKWIIANSPRYGVVIDVHLRDHVYVLFRLCLKAIVKEAFSLEELVLNRVSDEQTVVGDTKRRVSLKCPILVQVLMWFASQLSVLYGEVNGRCFAINIFKQFLLEAAPQVLLIPLEETSTHSSINNELCVNTIHAKDVRFEEPVERRMGVEIGKLVGKHVDCEVIFVSQVAAAVAAVLERSLLEQKIKGSQVSQQFTRYQRMAEHAYVSSKADEERKKRSDYRPIIDHDGLPRQRSSNQDSNKFKTKEELLAEERDYKRRRMSYRGKKVKRTTLQVMRDIIEEYMEGIQEAGGIGYYEKRTKEKGALLGSPSGQHFVLDADGQKSMNADSLEATRGIPDKYVGQSSSNFNGHGRTNRGRHGSSGSLEDKRSTGRNKHRGEYDSESPERYRSRERSSQRIHDRVLDDVEVTRTKPHEMKRSSGKSDGHDFLSNYHDSNHTDRFTVGKDDHKLKSKSKRERSKYGHHISDSVVRSAFRDRYDPSESHDHHISDSVVKSAFGDRYDPSESHDKY